MRRAPFVLFALLAFVSFKGVFTHLDSAFLGRFYVDAWGTQWFYWFIEHALWWRDDVAKESLFFFPWGRRRDT